MSQPISDGTSSSVEVAASGWIDVVLSRLAVPESSSSVPDLVEQDSTDDVFAELERCPGSSCSESEGSRGDKDAKSN